jgi:DNA-binding transcriptional ArsR family regulator
VRALHAELRILVISALKLLGTRPSETILAWRYHRAMAIDCSPKLGPAVALFRSLGDPTRLAILNHLASGEARVVDLTTELGLAQSTVSKHLACLRDCGLIDYRAQGRQSFYALARPELLDLLRSAEQLLAATGEAVALCPTYGCTPVAEVTR